MSQSVVSYFVLRLCLREGGVCTWCVGVRPRRRCETKKVSRNMVQILVQDSTDKCYERYNLPDICIVHAHPRSTQIKSRSGTYTQRQDPSYGMLISFVATASFRTLHCVLLLPKKCGILNRLAGFPPGAAGVGRKPCAANVLYSVRIGLVNETASTAAVRITSARFLRAWWCEWDRFHTWMILTEQHVE